MSRGIKRETLAYEYDSEPSRASALGSWNLSFGPILDGLFMKYTAGERQFIRIQDIIVLPSIYAGAR